MFTRLFKKKIHRASQWGAPIHVLPDLDVSDYKLGDLSFSDDIEKASFLGRPESIRKIDNDYYSLFYPHLGFLADFELNKLSYMGFIIGKDEPEAKSSELYYSSPTLILDTGAKTSISELTGTDDILALFGAASTIDEDDEEKIMTYVDGTISMEFEFNISGKLKRWNIYKNLEV